MSIENTKNTYLALTIGPIVKTLINTRKTKELWGASYLFSRIMREIICKLLQKKIINEDDILLPSPHMFDWAKSPPKWKLNGDLKDVKKLGAGLFPDRLYVKLQDDQVSNALQDAAEAANEVLLELGTIIDAVVKNGSCQDYLQQYFQLYFIKKDLEGDENIIYKLSPLLDTIELQSNFPQKEETKYLAEFLRRINESEPMINEAFSGRFRKAHTSLSLERFGFDSLPEITVREYGYLADEKAKNKFAELLEAYLDKLGVSKKKNKALDEEDLPDEKKLIKQLSSSDDTKSRFRTYHKYVAIVQADGDNVGKILKQIGNDPDEMKKFSGKLTEFSAKAVLMVYEYGGSPVYAGGDDLLFFAPVSMVQARKTDDNAGSHILHLLELLDKKFKEYLKDYIKHIPSLSFGVSVTYYAFPLGEALDSARRLLFGTAKQSAGKNAIAMEIQKHSGSIFGGIFRVGTESYRLLGNMLMPVAPVDKELEILKSVTYKLRENQGLIEIIGKEKTKVDNFMRNSFNESIHLDRDGKIKPYLQWVGKLIPAIYQETCEIKNVLTGESDAAKAMNQLFGILRMISFIKGEKL